MAATGFRAGMWQRHDRAEWSNEQQGEERDQCCRECDRREAVAGIQGSAGRRAYREGGVHRRPNPSHDLAGVLRPCQRQSQTESTRNDETLRRAEYPPAQQ